MLLLEKIQIIINYKNISFVGSLGRGRKSLFSFFSMKKSYHTFYKTASFVTFFSIELCNEDL